VGSGADQILFLPRETQHQSNIDVVSMVDEANDRDLNSGFLLTDLAGTHIDKWTSAQVLKTLHCLAYWTVNSDDGGCNCACSHLSINECASSLLKGK